MEKIIWHPSYETGIALLDQRHKELVSYFNSLLDMAGQQKKDKDSVRQQVFAFVNVMRSHISKEERYLGE